MSSSRTSPLTKGNQCCKCAGQINSFLGPPAQTAGKIPSWCQPHWWLLKCTKLQRCDHLTYHFRVGSSLTLVGIQEIGWGRSLEPHVLTLQTHPFGLGSSSFMGDLLARHLHHSCGKNLLFWRSRFPLQEVLLWASWMWCKGGTRCQAPLPPPTAPCHGAQPLQWPGELRSRTHPWSKAWACLPCGYMWLDVDSKLLSAGKP